MRIKRILRKEGKEEEGEEEINYMMRKIMGR